jgi:hypothetical protein
MQGIKVKNKKKSTIYLFRNMQFGYNKMGVTGAGVGTYRRGSELDI